MSNHDLKQVDHSNAVVKQNENNTSAVSIFPLVGTETQQDPEIVQNTTTPPPPTPTVSGGGSGY